MNKGCATVYMAGIATVKQFTPICHSVTVVKMPGRVRKDFLLISAFVAAATPPSAKCVPNMK